MGVGPRDIRVIRTDSLVDMGTPVSADGVLIRDATDGVVKYASPDTLGASIEEVQDNLGTSFLIGGNNVTLTYDDGANTLTIDSPGGDHSVLTNLAADDHTQYFNATRHDGHDHTTAMGSVVIDDISDVAISAPATADVLYYDGVGWINSALAASDISSGTFANARIAQGNVTQHEAALTITESQISDLAHLTIESVQDNLGTTFILGGNNLTVTYDDVANTLTLAVDALIASDITSGTFADARIAQSNVTQHQGALSITESQISDLVHYTSSNFTTDFAASGIGSLSNVTITSVTTDEILSWSGSAWINQTAAELGIALDTHTHPTADINTGTFADARISQSSVTQHQAALTITESQISDLTHWTVTDHNAVDHTTALASTSVGDHADVSITTPSTDQVMTYNGSSWVNQNAPSGSPAGAITMYGAASAPSGWLLCDGTAVSRTTYSDLFAAVGTTFGVGDGSTTFNLPNMLEKFPVGANNVAGDYDLGDTGGVASVTLTESQIPSHSHTASATTDLHSHTWDDVSTSDSHSHSVSGTTGTGFHSHTYWRALTGGGNDASSGSGIDITTSTASGGSHSHSWSDTSSSDSHSHTVSGTTAGDSHGHTITVNATGGGTSHENRPPFVALTFIIKT